VLHFAARLSWPLFPPRTRSASAPTTAHLVRQWPSRGRRPGPRRPGPLALRTLRPDPVPPARPEPYYATVWNFGIYAPLAQITDRTAFLLESEAGGDTSISTPEGWLVEIEAGQRPLPRVANGFWEYMAAGTGEEIDAARYDWNWKTLPLRFVWVPAPRPSAKHLSHGEQGSFRRRDQRQHLGLVPDELPHMEYTRPNRAK